MIRRFREPGPVRTASPHQLFGAQGGISGSESLGSNAPGPPGHVATDNTTVVFYINKQGGTQSHSLLHLVVDLFLWLHFQDTGLRARHIQGCLHPEITSGGVFPQWTCSPQSTALGSPSSCLQFQNLRHWQCSIKTLAGMVDILFLCFL